MFSIRTLLASGYSVRHGLGTYHSIAACTLKGSITKYVTTNYSFGHHHPTCACAFGYTLGSYNTHTQGMSSTAALPIRAVKTSTCLRRQYIFAECKEFASVPNHPALASIPKPRQFPDTQRFLAERDNVYALWDRTDIQKGVKELALQLDAEWPEWAATRTNAFGIIISDLFTHFLARLSALPTHAKSGTVTSEFEQHLFVEAEARHTLEYWHKIGTPPPAWFHLSKDGEKVIINPGQPTTSEANGKPSWRSCHETMKSGGSRLIAEGPLEGEWVYV
ncbi:unnamed protein product [Rhizoctonia solani]|uniref:Uncharacterized protein n=1 Tax=Rhizoctonia solani TaxID=456999 RepID=A0A8H3ALR1_9AGAM|nr:unnamed protein product [Rhizoctonia solani]